MLEGPSKTIVVEPLEVPREEPEPEPQPAKEPEKVPSGSVEPDTGRSAP